MRRRVTYQQVMEAILHVFNGNKDRAFSWWMAENEFMNNQIPFHMVKAGKGLEVLQFIRTRLCDPIK